MENNSSLTKISELIDKINHFHSDNLKTDSERISHLEKDLMLGYLRELYDLILSLPKETEEKKSGQKTVAKEPHKQEEKKTIIITKQPDTEQLMPHKKEVMEEVIKVIEQKEEQAKKTSSSVKAEMNLRTPSKSLNDKFQNKTSGLGEKIAEKLITDLKTAIGVNQRFGFIHELFSRNVNEYDMTVKSLNNCKSMDEAQNILQPIKTKYKWDEKNEMVKSFMELLKRKFLKN